jgi:hypothetical protein
MSGPARAFSGCRRLSPRTPYQSTPLSTLNAYARSWSLFGEQDELWLNEYPNTPDRRTGLIEFWFYNVTVGTTAVVTIELQASASQGQTGTLQVRSSDASPVELPINNSYQLHTVDLIVRPHGAYAVLVTVEPLEALDTSCSKRSLTAPSSRPR